jgi:hypothetical protein
MPEHQDAVKLESLRAALAQENDSIRTDTVRGIDVTARRTRREAITRDIAAVEEDIENYPFERRETEQAALLERIGACRQVRASNQQKALDAREQSKEYARLSDELSKEDWRWTNAPDGLQAAVQAHERHVARFGDLSGGQE